MTILKRSLLGSLAAVALMLPFVADAATATIQSLTPGASAMAKTNVTFSVQVSGFNTPYYHLTDSFGNTSINSTNINFGGNFQWVPSVTDIGTHNISVNVTDSDGNSATATQTIVILPPPSISIQSLTPGTTVMPGAPLSFSITAPGFTAPTYVVSDSFSGTSVDAAKINANGNFSWIPDATQNGDHVITVYASDSSGHSASAATPVRVGAGPTLAVPTNVNLTVSPGQTLSFTLIPTAYTPTGFSVADKFSGQSTLTTASVNTNGLVFWTPTASDAGPHTVTFMGQVGFYGQSASTTVLINVLGPGGVLIPPTITTTTSGAVTTSSTTGNSVSDLMAQLALLQSKVSGSAPTSDTSTGGFTFTSYLKVGSENNEVLELQKILKKLGFLTAAPNGYFGPSTLTAVKKFQAAHKLDQLGAVGPGTRAVLNSLGGGSSSGAVTTVAKSGYVFEHFMGVGDDDADVLELQKRLQDLGLLAADPTGHYGAGTEMAVKKYQTLHGLPVTGYVASDTRSSLNK